MLLYKLLGYLNGGHKRLPGVDHDVEFALPMYDLGPFVWPIIMDHPVDHSPTDGSFVHLHSKPFLALYI